MKKQWVVRLYNAKLESNVNEGRVMRRYNVCLFALCMSFAFFVAPSIAKSAKDAVKHITLTDVDTSSTLRSIRGPWKFPHRAITQEEFEGWLRRLGEMPQGLAFNYPKEPDFIPTRAVLSPVDYESLTFRLFDDAVQPEKVLDLLEGNPDKSRYMMPATPYEEYLGGNWIQLYRNEKLELVEDRISRIYNHYCSRRGTEWIDCGGITVGICHFDNRENRLDEDPLDSQEFLDLMKETMGNECPLVLKDESFPGGRFILIEPFYCLNIPFQYASMSPRFAPKLRVLGKMDQKLVLHVGDQIFFYDLDTRVLERRVMDLGPWEQLEIGLMDRTLFLVTVEGKWGEGSVCVLRKGDLQ